MQATDQAIHLSQRALNLKPSATFAVGSKVKALNAAGADIIGFGVGEPDFDTPEHIKQVAVDALMGGLTHYLPVQGEPAARKAIAHKLRRENGIECNADHIIISTGAKQSIFLALQALLDPGQEVIILTPAWVSYRPCIELAGGEVVEVPGAVDNDFKATPDQIEQAINARTKALLINSPSNPTGTMYSEDELRAIASVLENHPHVAVITDEIYEKLIFGAVEHFSLGSIPTIADRVITINGLSKAFAMTGWRIGYACAPGDDGAVIKAMSRLQGQMTSHGTSFCYPAIAEALTNSAEDVEQMRQIFADRAILIHERVTAMPNVVCPKPTGAFYVFPDISYYFGRRSPGGRLIEGALSFADALLEEAHVGVVPGDDFGECGHKHVRLSFAASTAVIEEGCRRITEWLGQIR